MNKAIKRLVYTLGVLAMLFPAGCKDDIAPEITALEVSRLFSPTDVDARIVNQTSVRLTWKPVKNARTYDVEFADNGLEDFSAPPVRTVTGVTFDQLPLVVSGFAGETDYSVRVRAIGEGIDDSKWISTTFRTDPEQILYPVDPEEITGTGVTLRWPPGEFATDIILTPGEIVRPVTQEEVNAGVAVITGLESETTYTARLMNGASTRGTVTFTTLLDLGGATPVYPEDNLDAVVMAAADGEVLVLYPGVYMVHIGDILLNKSITIKGLYPHNKPVIYNRFVLDQGVIDATFMDLEMVGDHPDLASKLSQAFVFEPGTYNVNSVVISGCIIREFNQALIYGGASIVIRLETLTIHNCVMSDIVNDGGDFIDFRGGHVVNLSITNSTFNRVASAPRDFIRLDNSSGSFPGSKSTVLIDRCTFYQVSNTRRILYIRFFENETTVTNTIFAGADAEYTGYFSNQSTTTQPICSRNNYFNAPAFLGGVNNGVFDISGTHTTLNPGFVNPGAGNFRITNDELILFGIGDPRWIQ